MTTKETVLEILQKLPDDATIEDMMEELYVFQQIELGLKQMEDGDVVSHEEAKRRLAKWRV